MKISLYKNIVKLKFISIYSRGKVIIKKLKLIRCVDMECYILSSLNIHVPMYSVC